MKGQAPCGTPGTGVHREFVKFDLMYYTVHRQFVDSLCPNNRANKCRRIAKPGYMYTSSSNKHGADNKCRLASRLFSSSPEDRRSASSLEKASVALSPTRPTQGPTRALPPPPPARRSENRAPARRQRSAIGQKVPRLRTTRPHVAAARSARNRFWSRLLRSRAGPPPPAPC